MIGEGGMDRSGDERDSSDAMRAFNIITHVRGIMLVSARFKLPMAPGVEVASRRLY